MPLTNEQIRILIIEKIAGVIDPDDDAILESLIQVDPAVRDMWLEISEEVRQAASTGFSTDVDTPKHWNRLTPLLETAPSSKLRILSLRILAAACIVGVIAIGSWWLKPQKASSPGANASIAKVKSRLPTLELADHQLIELARDEHRKFTAGDILFELNGKMLTYQAAPGNNQTLTLSVPPGADFNILLPDGTKVSLNAATVLRFPANFNGNTRELSLEGEAFFEVAKNVARPFVVHTLATQVFVTGTSFNVNTYNAKKIETSLVEGSVILRNKGFKEFHLEPGFEGHLTDHAGFESKPFDSAEVLSWMKGIYYFRNTPLKELSQVMKRWYDVDTEFANIAIKDKTFSGELRKNQPLAAFLENLNLSGDVVGQLKNGTVFFK